MFRDSTTTCWASFYISSSAKVSAKWINVEQVELLNSLLESEFRSRSKRLCASNEFDYETGSKFNKTSTALEIHLSDERTSCAPETVTIVEFEFHFRVLSFRQTRDENFRYENIKMFYYSSKKCFNNAPEAELQQCRRFIKKCFH